MQTASSRIQRIGLDVFYCYIGTITLINGLIATRVMRGWILGDWLINYEGGFVRRGLTGQVALLLARPFHTTPVLFVVLLYLSLYAVFFLTFRSLASRIAINLWMLALIVSPATLSFQVLHRGSGFRKEILFIAALSIFVVLLTRGRMSLLVTAACLSGILALITLSHEGLVFYSPYFAGAFAISGRSALQTAKACLVPLLCGAVVFAVCVGHLGDTETATRICSSLGYRLQVVPGSTEICANGAIPYLAKTRTEGGEEALDKIARYGYLQVFPIYLLVALLPAVGESVVLVRARMGREVKILWTTFAFSFVGTLVLFRYAVDWGRWIYIHVVSITLLLLLIEIRRSRRAAEESSPPPDAAPARRIAGWALVFVYATFWILPSDTETLRWGYAGRVLDTLHVTSKAPNAERIPRVRSTSAP